ncbi:MAG: ABC transporter ATP-binding protein/permease [Ilumatobacteraceae bacterium]|jgi:ATP-binding cassette subfamily B protein|nr:ABC transporter ATP-binding protein/permease [Ilumatobacteraceae bacterium]
MHVVGMPVEKSENFSATARRLMGLMAGEKYLVAFIMTLAVLSVALVVSGPRVLGHATDILFNGLTGRDGNDGVNFAALHRTLWWAVAVYALSFLLAYGQTYLLAGVVQRTMYALRSNIEAKIHRLPLSYIDQHSRGDLLSRVTNDIDNISQSLQQSLSQLITSLLTIIGVLVMMLSVSPLLALIAIVTVPLSVLSMKQIANRSKKRFIAQWSHTGALNGLIEETFTGHAIVKTFGKQAEVEERFAVTNEKLFEAGFGAQFMSGSIQPAMMFVGNINYVLIALVGGLRVASGSMGLGDVQAFIQYSRQFTQPLTQTASMMNVLQSGVASAERVFEVLDTEEESIEPPSRLTGEVKGRIAFENVHFAYDPERPLIEDLSLVAEPGTTVAIVGPTGAGKTTLVNLVMRFYDLQSGRITLDGIDIASIPRRELRQNIGMVLQDTWLFGGTIRQNIAYGNPSATEEQIRAAAKAAYVDRFVHSLPKGYDTVLDNEGGAVSAGEKQLLTIARAFLADPSILILDEATSSVDTRTEVLIQKAMVALRSQRTSFVIAHRLSTIRDAHVILVMESGRIVEQGNHEDLIAAKGAYYRLYQSQFSGAATDLA